MPDKDGKTEKPTPKRLSEARKEGRIPKSQELVQWASIFIGISMLQRTVNAGAKLCREEMDRAGKLMANPDAHSALGFMTDSMGKAFMACMPLMLLFAVLAIVGHLAQVRLVLSFKSIKPDFKKINPVTGTKKLFSMQSVFQTGKQILKLVILGWLVYATIYKQMTALTTNGPYAIGELMRLSAKAVMTFVRQVALIGVVIGFLDYGYSRKKTMDGMKMTKQEVKDEYRQQDVAPEIKSKIRQKQRQMSRNRMMAAMKEADVIIVNPVHIAIALKYDPQRGAPTVLAKGAGFVAEKLREKADEYNIPTVQDIPLARALHRSCEIDDEIPNELFQAVARVLAFVFALKNRGVGIGFHKMPGTPDLEDVEPFENERHADEQLTPV